MPSTVLIIGAGADKTTGIGLPLASELIPSINTFLQKDETGRRFNEELRKLLPHLRFTFEAYVSKAVEHLSNEFRNEVDEIIRSVSQALNRNGNLSPADTKLATVLIRLLQKIKDMQSDVRLDHETEDLILQVFDDIVVSDDAIVNLPKLTFTDTFNIVMKRIFERSLAEPSHPVLRHVYRNLLDLEALLLRHFLGFYNDVAKDIKNYLYISWMMWAYLKHNEMRVLQSHGDSLPFYQTIPPDWEIINFNYTSFARRVNPHALYFHGDLDKYIRIRDRNQLAIDHPYEIDLVDFVGSILAPNISFTEQQFVIPSIIPPLRLKPVLSNEYIEIWYRAAESIKNAGRIIVVGYSFNYADEHFNDIIRRNKDKSITIIDPAPESIIKNTGSILRLRREDYARGQVQDRASFTSGNVTIISATAEQTSLDRLIGDGAPAAVHVNGT